jgi:hypothetical protein
MEGQRVRKRKREKRRLEEGDMYGRGRTDEEI